MSDVLDRGLTVTELAPMDQAIDVTPDTTTAFVGRALRGPLNKPVRVTSVTDFRRRFGDIWSRSSLGPAVQQFFEHGGRNLIIVRVANGARSAMLCLPASGSALVLRAVEPGSTETVRAAVDYDGIDPDNDEWFNLTVQRIDPDTGLVLDQELHRRVSYRQDAERFVADALVLSELVRVEQPFPTHRPESTTGVHHPFESDYVEQAQAGSNGRELTDYDLIGSRQEETGIFALRQLDALDLLYLPPPGKTRDHGPASMLAAERFCRERGAMLVCDPPQLWDSVDAAIDGVRRAGLASANLLTYFPRMVSRTDPDSPPRAMGGAIAGLLCKHDARSGPWVDLGATASGFKRRWRPAFALDADDEAVLQREGLNTIRPGALGRATLAGNVTMARGHSFDRQLDSLAVKRFTLQVINAIERGIRWAVFQGREPGVPARIESQVNALLAGLHAEGALTDDRFSVECAPAAPTLTGASLHLRVEFRPAGCQERVGFSLHLAAGQCRVTPVAFAALIEDCA